MIAAGFGLAVIYCRMVANHIPEADPDHRFNRPTFSGALYNAGKPDAPDAEEGVRTSDVIFSAPPPRPSDAWRTGGVMHLYGGGRPQVVVFGSSHAMMYSRLIDEICRERKLSVSFLGMDYGTPAFFASFPNANLPTRQEAREFDDTRRKWLREWHPEAVFAIDRWDSHVGPEHDFAIKLRSFLREATPLVGRMLFVAQVPTAEQGEWVNLRGYIDWRWSRMKDRGPPRLMPDFNEPKRHEAVAAAAAATSEFPNLRVVRADLPFYEPDGSIRYAAGRDFFYLDDDHLTDVGTEEVHALFEEAIAEAHAAAHAHVQ